MKASPEIWVTRPLPVAERTAESVASLGLRPIVAPLLTIQNLPAMLPATPSAPKGWIFTSRHAPHALRAVLAHQALHNPSIDDMRLLPAWCVGTRTAEAAIAVGFPMAQFMGENGVAMVRRLGPRLETMRGDRTRPYELWYAASRTRRHDLNALLKPWEVSVRVLELYESVPATRLPAEAETGLRNGTLKAVLLYSPETARAFARVVTQSGLDAQLRELTLFCLSEAVANACPKQCAKRIVALHPSEGFMMQSLDAWAKTA